MSKASVQLEDFRSFISSQILDGLGTEILNYQVLVINSSLVERVAELVYPDGLVVDLSLLDLTEASIEDEEIDQEDDRLEDRSERESMASSILSENGKSLDNIVHLGKRLSDFAHLPEWFEYFNLIIIEYPFSRIGMKEKSLTKEIADLLIPGGRLILVEKEKDLELVENWPFSLFDAEVQTEINFSKNSKNSMKTESTYFLTLEKEDWYF